jgi:serine/threonine-protein kinase
MAETDSLPTSGQVIGRYAFYDMIGSGGTASVHLGRMVGAVGFSRTVAIKRLHPSVAMDPEFVSMFLDEVRLASRIRHPNVVATLDVVALQSELFMVMEYIPGEPISRLIKACKEKSVQIPQEVAARIIADTLQGLQAAHVATDEMQEPLHIVHRDISPQNVLVSPDGTAHLLDFGIAKAQGRVQVTQEGMVKGKFRYMAPEQLEAKEVAPWTDVYAVGVVLWEMLTCEPLFGKTNSNAELITRVIRGLIRPPSEVLPGLDPAYDRILLKALSREPEERYQSAAEMLEDLQRSVKLATAPQVGAFVKKIAAEWLVARAEVVSRIERLTLREDGSGPHSVGGMANSRQTAETLSSQRHALGTSGSFEAGLTERTKSSMTRPAITQNTSITQNSQITGSNQSSTDSLRNLSQSLPPGSMAPAPYWYQTWRVALIPVVLLIGLMAGGTIMMRGSGEKNAAAQPPPTNSVAAPPASTSPPTPAAPSTSAPVAPSTVASVAPDPATTKKDPAPSGGGSRKGGSSAPPPPRKGADNPNCKNPFTVDADGTRMVKPECL